MMSAVEMASDYFGGRSSPFYARRRGARRTLQQNAAGGLQAGLLDGRNMDEYVLAAAIWRDEVITLLAVKPLHCTARHVALPSTITIAAVERRFAALGK